ncbi:MAG: DUF3127 domain-containing protein [Bacteroidales bacterium]|nr:DUF3127 domain-containing protein [Bacteroidales bacterium]
MAFELTGKVIDIQPVQQVSEKFRKREFVIEKQENSSTAIFVDYVKFQLVQDKCDLINDSFMNTEVKVSFNIKGNKWERDGKVNYFTNLDAWRIERVDQAATTPQSAPSTPNTISNDTNDLPPYVNTGDDIMDDDQLPF